MRLNSESIETILERFDRRDDADADYVMAHWRESVDVYEHDGSMLDLDNIVRLETVLGDRIGYDAYHRINSTMEDLGEWLEQGLLVREASDGARRTAGSGGVPLNWIRGRLDEWIRTAPIDADARYTWTAGLADQSERDVMRVWAEDELAQVVEDHYWIGNGVLDRFLEDESLFGEFLRTPVSKGGVEPLVVGPPHVVVGVMPQLLDRGVVVPVHELLLQQPVRRFDHGVVVGVALV